MERALSVGRFYVQQLGPDDIFIRVIPVMSSSVMDTREKAKATIDDVSIL